MLTPILFVVVPLALLAVYVTACRITARSFSIDRDAHERARSEWAEFRRASTGIR